MKQLTLGLLILLTGCRAVIDRTYLTTDTPKATAAAASGCDELRIAGKDGTIYGQVLRPAAIHGERRPVVIVCHAFEGFARFDDLAQALCRTGCVVVMPFTRGFLGSGGAYSVEGGIRDLEAIIDYVRTKEFRTKYNAYGRAVFLLGHSVACPTIVAAASERVSAVRGLMLLSPCDIAYQLSGMPSEVAHQWLESVGAQVLKSDGIDAIYNDLMANTNRLALASSAVPLKGMNVFLATSAYDCFASPKPVDAFWEKPVAEGTVRTRRPYAADLSLTGVRCELSSDVTDFIIGVMAGDKGLKFMTDEEVMLELYARMQKGTTGENRELAAVMTEEGEEIACEGDSVAHSVSSHAHAAMKVIQAAEDKLDSHDLTTARLTLYTTVEPCAMCAGGIVQAGIRRVVYGVSAEKQAKATGKDVDVNANWRKDLAVRGIEVIGPVEEEKGVETLKKL